MAICNRRGGRREGAGRPKNQYASARVTVPLFYASLFRWLLTLDGETLDALIEGRNATIELQKDCVRHQIRKDVAEIRYRNLREGLVKAALREFNQAKHEETRAAITRIMRTAELAPEADITPPGNAEVAATP